MAKDSSVYKYTVASLAEDLGLPPETVRQRLRRAEVEKNSDGMYGWNSFKAYNVAKAAVKDAGRAPEKRAAAKSKATPKKTKKGGDRHKVGRRSHDDD